MEYEIVPSNNCYNIALFRKCQISSIIVCIVSYVIVTAYYVSWYDRGLTQRVSLSKKCESDYGGFVEEFQNVKASSEEMLNTDGVATSCPCLHKTCLPKCCPSDQRLHSANGMTCVSSSTSFSSNSLTIYHTILPNQTVGDLRLKNVTPSDIHTFAGRSVCNSGQSYKMPTKKAFHLEDGTVLSESGSVFVLIDLDEYCVELADDKLAIFTTGDCADGWTELADLLENTLNSYYVYDVYNHIGCLVIFLTVSITSYLSGLRNLHGKILFCFLTSFGAGFIILTIFYTYNYKNQVLVDIWNILSLSEYLWMTSMCFDLWSVFSRPLQTVQNSSKENLKLIVYCLYSWALPSFLRIYYNLRLAEIRESLTCKELHFKKDLCRTNEMRLLYISFLLPIYLQVALNLVMFLSTVVNLRLHSRRSSWLSGGESRRHSQAAKEGLWMYIKLSLTMGIPGAFIVVLYNLEPEETNSLSRIFRVIVLLNYPIMLACVLLGNKRVLRLLRKKIARSG